MFSHWEIWDAIDRVAERQGWSVGRLATRAGLDPTALHASKRASPDGKARWPSSATISKVLQASGTTMQEFTEILEDCAARRAAGGEGPSLAPADLIVTDRLKQRSLRPTRPGQEIDAFQDLSRRMLKDPADAIHAFTEHAVVLCEAGSAGVSVLAQHPDGGPYFRWEALAGRIAPHVGGKAPRYFSPSGLCLDRGTPILVTRPGRVFTYLGAVPDEIVEALVLPVDDGAATPLGTVWVVAHDEAGCHFSLDTIRILSQLAIQVAIALKLAGRTSGHASPDDAARPSAAPLDASGAAAKMEPVSR